MKPVLTFFTSGNLFYWLRHRTFLFFCLIFLITTISYAQCIQATSNTTSTIPILSSILNPTLAYDLADGNTTTAATLTVNGVGLAILKVTFDHVANPGDSIIVFFGVPTANILDWGSLGGTTFTPYSGTNATGTASASVTAANLSFLITLGANSLARIAIPVTSLAGAQSLQISYLGIGAALNKRTFIYDVAVKPGPVVTSANQFVCSPGGTATFTGRYNTVGSTPIDVLWYASNGTTVLKTDANHTGTPYVSSFTTPFVTTTTTFYVRERWTGCAVLSDPKQVTINVRTPLTPDISITCGPPVKLTTTTSGAQGAVSYVWAASGGGTITSGGATASPTITSPGNYQVTLTDANGCNGTITESFTATDCVALPVTLVSFNVKKEESVISLEWVTSSEINSDRFDIERSSNGKNWSVIGAVATSENGSLNYYSFTDVTPADGSNLYRLKMIDRDGSYSYSRIQSMDFANASVITVFPNPVESDNRLHLFSDERKVSLITLYDVYGKKQFESDQVANGIDVKDLSTGKYIVKVKLKDGSESSHVVIKN